jgi:hypothetical protein
LLTVCGLAAAFRRHSYELLRWHRVRITRSLRSRPCETGRGQCVRLEVYRRVRASLLETRGRPSDLAWRELVTTLEKGERFRDEPPFRAVVGSRRASGVRG